MACFLVPATEAIVTTIVAKAVKSEEQTKVKALSEDKLPLSKKITRLSGFLWGGSGLLAFEHLWHGEISPFFPFLTAANDPSEMAVAFHEMATVGTSMAVLVTAVWAVLTVVSDKILKRKPRLQSWVVTPYDTSYHTHSSRYHYHSMVHITKSQKA